MRLIPPSLHGRLSRLSAGLSLAALLGLATVSPGGRGGVLRRLRERGRTPEGDAPAGELLDDGDPLPRLVAALERATTAHEAADALLDEVAGRRGAEIAGIVLVDERGERARGLRARGVDDEWWAGISIDLADETGAVASVVRDLTPFAVYDATSTPNVNARLADDVGAKSVAFVPLVTEGACVAVLMLVATSDRRFFSSAELEGVMRLADEAAPVIERLRSEVALRSALEREKLVAEIARKVRSELDIDDVLQVAVAETGRALDVARCFVRLGPEADAAALRAEWRRPGLEPIPDATALPGTNLATREGRTVAIPDVEHAPELDDRSLGGRDALLRLGTRSVLATPIVVFDRTIGIFGLHRDRPGAWSGGEIAVAEAVAGELGIAIHAARLLEEDERRLGLQGALLKAAQVVTSDLRFESVLRRLVDEVAVLFGADAADCWMFEPGSKVLRCRAVYGLDEAELGRRVPVQGAHARAIETGRPVLARDFARTEGELPSPSYAAFEEIMVAPMTWLGEVRGVLGVCSTEAGRFDSSEVEILDAFARFASLASHNAESFEERARQARIQQGFYRIAEVLGSSLSLAETRDALANAAADALGADAAAVLELHGDRLVCAGSYRLPDDLASGLEDGLPADASPLGGAATEGRTVAAQDLAADDRFDERARELLGVPGHAALLAAPVHRDGENSVVVVLFRDRRSFSEEDLTLTHQLSGAARGALERAEHFESVSRARLLSDRLAALGARLVANLAPQDVLAEAAREARSLLAADAAVVRLLEDDELVVRAADGPGTDGLLGAASSSGHGLLGDVAQSRRQIAVPDVGADADAARGDDLLGGPMQAAVAVPLAGRGGGLRGVLSVYASGPRTWRADETQALVALAALVSAALSNAELYRFVAEEKERSEAILSNIADGIVAVDREGTIVLWNSMAEQITGVPAGEALGRRLSDTLQRDLSSGEGEAAGEREVTIVRGGTEVWLALTEADMRDASGNVRGRIFAFRDVSDERAVEEMKSDFVATVSHELRTPLTSIYGFAETLLRADIAFDERERATFLSTIASESERLIRIVDDLLNVARLEAGMLGLAVRETDLGALVREEVERVRRRLDGRHAFDVALEDGLAVAADPERLAQVLHHLVDNAVKFSPSGGTITIEGRRRPGTAELRVKDEGVGLSPTERQRIFTKFFRGATGEEVAAHGTGLGLFLARGLVVAMGGRMWLESDARRGSTFAFELPLAGAAAEKEV